MKKPFSEDLVWHPCLDIASVKKYLGQMIELDQKLKDLQNAVDSSLKQDKLDEGQK
jgi:hypothetical protein